MWLQLHLEVVVFMCKRVSAIIIIYHKDTCKALFLLVLMPTSMQMSGAAFPRGRFALVNAPSGAGSVCGCVVGRRRRRSTESLQRISEKTVT